MQEVDFIVDFRPCFALLISCSQCKKINFWTSLNGADILWLMSLGAPELANFIAKSDAVIRYKPQAQSVGASIHGS